MRRSGSEAAACQSSGCVPRVQRNTPWGQLEGPLTDRILPLRELRGAPAPLAHGSALRANPSLWSPSLRELRWASPSSHTSSRCARIRSAEQGGTAAAGRLPLLRKLPWAPPRSHTSSRSARIRPRCARRSATYGSLGRMRSCPAVRARPREFLAALVAPRPTAAWDACGPAPPFEHVRVNWTCGTHAKKRPQPVTPERSPARCGHSGTTSRARRGVS